jgi:phosphatidate cytidylyltransferase
MKGNLFIRSIAGIVFSATIICSALLGERYFGLLFLFFAVVGLNEFYSLSHTKISFGTRSFGLFIGAAIYAFIFLSWYGYIDAKWSWSLGAILPVWACAELFRSQRQTAVEMAWVVFGWLYVVLPFALLNVMAHHVVEFNHELLIGLFAILWANDTGAYAIGRLIGKRKLMPAVSPNKTWEGLFGGMATAILVGYLWSLGFSSLVSTQWIVIASIIAVGANLGDLIESKFKRDAEVKDSGQLIPGHGGVLDRFDGLLICAPIITVYIHLIS